MPKNKYRYNEIFVVVDRLSKQAISTPCFKTATAKDIARIFLSYVYRYYKPLQTIVLDRGPQFVSKF
jgi:hypothetical protein